MEEKEIIRAFNETERKGKDNPLEYFRKILRKKPPRQSFEETYSK